MSNDLHVIFNGDCPVCSHEIGAYARYAGARALPIRFEDLNCIDLAAYGLTEDQAARRLYVLKDGQMYGGIDGFLVLWAEMPRYRWLGRVVGLPGVRPLAALTYDRLLAPTIYRWHRRRKPLASGAGRV